MPEKQSPSRAVSLAFPLIVLLMPSEARPQPPTATAEQPPSPPGETGASETVSPPSAEPDKADKKKKKKDAAEYDDGARTTELLGGRLELKGRVFARGAYQNTSIGTTGALTETEGLDLSVASARFGIKYDVLDFVSLVIEADVGDQPLLRDGFIQARSKRLRGRIGQFKMPLSSITLDSPWSLPIARRGMIQGLLAERLFLVGRRPGASASVRGGGWLDPELTLGAFQGAFLQADFDEDLFRRQGLDVHNLVARLGATPGGVDVAVVGARTTILDGNELRHFWAAGPDATFEIPFGQSALRGWAEAFLGNVRHVRPTADPATFERYESRFWSARAILAWRWGGLEEAQGYVEPFAYFGAIDPDSAGSSDLFWETFVGVNVGFWRSARITLQYEMADAQGSFPQFFFPGNLIVQDHKAVILQVGAAF
jgi:hypothetical protein